MNIRQNMMMVIGGVLVMVIGIVLADVVIDTATTALTNASIGSFAGASAVGGLIPLIYFTVVILIGVGMMGIGARGFVGVVAVPVFLTGYPLALLLAVAIGMYAAYYLHQRKSFRGLSAPRE